jgi:hypothetical protein
VTCSAACLEGPGKCEETLGIEGSQLEKKKRQANKYETAGENEERMLHDGHSQSQAGAIVQRE